MALAMIWNGFASSLQFVNFQWDMFMWPSRHVLDYSVNTIPIGLGGY